MAKQVPAAVQEHRKRRGLDPITGKPIMDPTPLAPPIGYKKAPSIFDQVRQAIRTERLAELEQLRESLEQAEDYEIEDDPPDPESRWEHGSQYTVAELMQMVEDKKEALAAQAAAQEEALRQKQSSAVKGAREAGDQGGEGGPPPSKKSSPKPSEFE